MEFKLSWKQRGATAGGDTNIFSVGFRWSAPLMSYIQPETTLDDHFASWIYLNGKFTNLPTAVSNTSTNYHMFTTIREQYDTNNNFTSYSAIFPDGSLETYGFLVTNSAGTLLKAFLSAKQGPDGSIVQYEYDENYDPGAPVIRLTQVLDGDGHANTIVYATNHPYSTNLIAKITSPFGAEMKLDYDDDGYLTSIVDAAGITNIVHYDVTGNVDYFQTPYGTTSFFLTDSTDSSPDQRSVTVTEPDGSKQFFLYRNGLTGLVPDSYSGSQVPSTTNANFSITNNFDKTNLEDRNTFHWGTLQYPELSTNYLWTGDIANLTANDFRLARMTHWLSDDSETPRFGQTRSLQRLPSPDRGATAGNLIWYDYEGKTNSQFEGTSSAPMIVAELLPDGSAKFTRMIRNASGKPQTESSTYTRTDGAVDLRTITFGYATNLIDLVTIDGPLGREWTFQYNSFHQVTLMSNVLAEATIFHYNSLQQVTQIVTASGLTVTNEYYTTGDYTNWLKRTHEVESGASTAFTYLNGRIETETDTRGLVVTNYWDGLGRLTGLAFTNGASILSISNIYTVAANTFPNSTGGTNLLELTATKDRMNNWSYFGYDSKRRLIAETNEINTVTRYGFCNCGSLSYVTNAFGTAIEQVTHFTYDTRGRVIGMFFADGSWQTNTFDSAGRLSLVADPFTRRHRFYNNQGLLTTRSNETFGVTSSAVFDIRDRLLQLTDQNGVLSTNTFDALDRLNTNVVVGVATNIYSYTARGLTNHTDALQHITRYVHDALGRRTSETNANNEATIFGYHPSGDLLTLTDGKNQVTTWNYDQFGRVTNKVQHGGTEILRYRYDANDRLTNRWSREKLETYFTYYNDGTLSNINYTASPDLTFSYDALGRPTTMIDGLGTSSFTYSKTDQVLTEDGPWANDVVTYSYTNRLRKSLSLAQPYASAWQQSYTYDALKRLAGVTSPAGAFGYGYSGGTPPAASALVRHINLPNGAFITNTWDAGRLVGTFLKNSSGTNLNSHEYLHEAFRRSRQTFKDGNYVFYTYDNIGQLQRTTPREATGADRDFERRGYGYDSAGNLAYRTNYANGQTFAVNDLNQLSSVTRNNSFYSVSGFTTVTPTSVSLTGTGALGNVEVYSDNTFSRIWALQNGTNIITAVATDALGRSDTNTVTFNLPSTVSFTYDANGNLTSDGARSFGYDDENQLTTAQGSDWRSEFVYDALGRRRITREYAGGGPVNVPLVTGVTLSSTVLTNFSGWVGFKFTVGANNIVVKELGRWMRNGNQGTHSVKLANGSGTDISGASVSVNSGIGQPGAFNYVTLSSPVTLLANTSYYLTSQEVNGGDEWYEYDSALTSSGVATIDNAVWALNSSTSYAQVGSAGNSYVPVSLKYETVGWTAAGETRHVYDGMLPIQERDAHNVPVVTYTRGTDLSGSRQGAGGIGGLLARTDHREPDSTLAHAFYHADGSGNVTMMISSRQLPVAKYQYDPFGNTLVKSGPLAEANTYRFSSKEIHGVSGTYYYGYRFYDPNLQRWLNQDPIEEGGLNLYAFNYNDPNQWVDPDGLNPKLAQAITWLERTKASRWLLRQMDKGLNRLLNLWGRASMGSPTSCPVPTAPSSGTLQPTAKSLPDSYAGIRQASQYLQEMGVSRADRVRYLQSFEPQNMVLRQAGQSEFGLRYFSDPARAGGQYLFETFPASRSSLAIKPEWSTMSGFRQFQIRPGATILEGRAAAQGANLPGSQIQKFILDWRSDLMVP